MTGTDNPFHVNKENQIMANDITLTAQTRAVQGSGAVGRLRREGVLPAVIGLRAGGTSLIQLSTHEFTQMLRHHHADQLLVTLTLDGKSVPAIMREVQYDVLSGVAIHVDFSEISLTERLRVECALHLSGDPEGVRVGGGVLEQLLRSIHVETLPGDIVDFFTVDVTNLALGSSITVADLNFGDKYRITTPKNIVVAAVVAADAEIVVAPAATEGLPAGGATPEVIAKGKKDEAGAAPAAGAPAAKAPAKK